MEKQVKSQTVLVLAAAGVMVASLFTAVPATASSIDLTDPTALVNSIAPEIAGTSANPVDVEVGSDSPNARGGSPQPTTVDVAAPASVSEEPGISFTIDYAAGVTEQSGGFTVVPTTSTDSFAYAQPTAGGVRILTAISSRDAGDEFSYTFDVPEGTELVPTVGGYRIQPPTGPALGALQDPWAKDSAGTSLPTAYEWADGQLTQTVDLSGDVQFPVLIDPNWTYAFGYVLSPSVTIQKSWSNLHLCFNCYFPVTGAPAGFPSYNQTLPLTVGWGGINSNFTCIMGATWSQTNVSYGWDFLTGPGHVDGPGSQIIFELGKNPSGDHMLYVNAWIVNDFFLGNTVYSIAAANNWNTFAHNLRTISITA